MFLQHEQQGIFFIVKFKRYLEINYLKKLELIIHTHFIDINGSPQIFLRRRPTRSCPMYYGGEN